MHQLEVVVLDESHVVSTEAELVQVMALRTDGGNHFQIASTASLYPMLDLLVRDPYAVVHYWVHEGIAGDQADARVLDAPEEVAFRHSSAGDTITMPGSVLVMVNTAMSCVEEFARTLSRPTLVNWIEL